MFARVNHAFAPVKPWLHPWEQASTVQNLSFDTTEKASIAQNLSFGTAEEAFTVRNLYFGTTEEASTVRNLYSINANFLFHRVESWLQAINKRRHLVEEVSDRSDASFLYQNFWLPITILMF